MSENEPIRDGSGQSVCPCPICEAYRGRPAVVATIIGPHQPNTQWKEKEECADSQSR